MNKSIAPVLDEITALLKKHDLVGLVMVGDEQTVDYRMEVGASWSCAWLEQTPDGQVALRIRSRREDYPDAAERTKKLENTVGTFVTLLDCTQALEKNLEQVLVMIAKSVKFDGKSTWLE